MQRNIGMRQILFQPSIYETPVSRGAELFCNYFVYKDRKPISSTWPAYTILLSRPARRATPESQAAPGADAPAWPGRTPVVYQGGSPRDEKERIYFLQPGSHFYIRGNNHGAHFR
ncbi:hypothetical protein [Bordetella pertussis]|uniref:hypothetical protein n=1 Tax=Bordetella pertussis TaxID=520 RepID=UPI0018A6D2D2|nr:hypothetical protein [Bordetella pertussis]